MRTNVIRTCHDDVGHVGIDKTIELIKRFYWFPKMKIEVVKLYATKITSTREVIICLRNYFEYFGTPFRLVSDRGTSFTSGAFREF